MLLYAWHLADRPDPVSATAAEEFPTHLGELFAFVLCRQMDAVLRRGLDQDYVEHEDMIRGVRGQLQFAPTVLRQLDIAGRTLCRFDDRSPDIPANQLIKAAAGILLRCHPMSRGLRDRLALLRARLSEVRDVRPDDRLLGRVHLHRNNRRYQLPIAICRLVVRRVAPDDRDGRLGFERLARDEHWMRQLFEAFVLGFYHAELQTRPNAPRSIGAERFRWSHDRADEAIPTLNTDVTLRWLDRVRIIECKFTQKVTSARGDGPARLDSNYLRQLYAYCMAAAERRGGGSASTPPDVDGVLLHAQPRDGAIDVSTRLGHIPIRAATVDLTQNWPDIRARLLDVAERTIG